MAVLLDMRVCALLAARLCHDFSGPIAAIGNGAELLGDDDPDFAREAAALIGDSARIAARRLQLFPFVYGFTEGALAGPPPRALASEYFAGSAIVCDYADSVAALPLATQQLACSLLLVAAEALPRGGTLSLDVSADGIVLDATGDGAGPSPGACDALGLETPVEGLTSRTVGAYLAGKLAEAMGRQVAVTARPGGFRLATVLRPV